MCVAGERAGRRTDDAPIGEVLLVSGANDGQDGTIERARTGAVL